MIPFEPDTVNTGAGKSSYLLFWLFASLYNSEKMKISFNSLEQDFPLTSSLFDVLAQQQLQNSKGIAVAVNGNVVPRAQWREKLLEENDTILVIKAAQGG